MNNFFNSIYVFGKKNFVLFILIFILIALLSLATLGLFIILLIIYLSYKYRKNKDIYKIIDMLKNKEKCKYYPLFKIGKYKGKYEKEFIEINEYLSNPNNYKKFIEYVKNNLVLKEYEKDFVDVNNEVGITYTKDMFISPDINIGILKILVEENMQE